MLEMFAGRRPTVDMFKDCLNLHNFVKMALPKRLIQVINPMLLPREPEKMRAITTAIVETEEDGNGSEVEQTEENNKIEYSRQMDVDMQTCLLSILNIGLMFNEIPKR